MNGENGQRYHENLAYMFRALATDLLQIGEPDAAELIIQEASKHMPTEVGARLAQRIREAKQSAILSVQEPIT
ncbi:MAG: hypothetical protein UY16_C0007G0023 [Candidatus Gottesmanbacteria bacterium GW2011_GWA2_47_9]|uniref:Uncharacterized protein n=1 Tax=Candidatus Gottesmanbacteria bacterium GW2011_GWA2_47_9 TaxID=1618445 RepID=A0A0G1U2Z3_9BACT|nr:MAG: hypothetical protein UY16_C0007G0023 [Candidatus Gottesmanbacteria bacterium GW2011_GWA2_47_9]